MFQSQKAFLLSSSHSLLIDRKFDTAIRRSQIEAFLERLHRGQPTEDDDLLHAHFTSYHHMLTNTTLLPNVLLTLIESSAHGATTREPLFPRLADLIGDNIDIQQAYNARTIPGYKLPSIRYLLNSIPTRIRNLLSILLHVNRQLSECIESLSKINTYDPSLNTRQGRVRARSKINTWYSPDLELKITWSNHMAVFEHKGTAYLQPRPVLLQLQNKIADFISVLTLVSLQAGVSFEPEAAHYTLEFVQKFHHLHATRPYKFFEIVKAFEGFIVSLIIKRQEEWCNDDLYKTIIHEVETSTGFSWGSGYFSELLEKCSTALLAELSCLVKLSGHPLIDIEAGNKKLYDRVQEEFPINIGAVAHCVTAIKKNYVRNFIVRHGRWPACSLDMRLAHPALKYAYARFVDPYSLDVRKKHGDLEDYHWAAVDLEPEMRFIYAENILPLLKDKAISVVRSRAVEAYLQHEGKRITSKETRLLLYYLFTHPAETDHMKYIMKYMESEDDLDEVLDYLVIRIVPKEKELKEAYRGFGCKTYMDRARSIIQEINAMQYLDLTSDEQAMTLSELALTKKLYAYRNLKKLYPQHRIVMINFDASGWNNKFRRDTTDRVLASTLDPIFNVHLYRKTQAAYERSMIYVPDPLHPTAWDGQLGGIEGLNQDSWVIIYLAQIKYAFRNIEYATHMLVKGDDLRVCVAIPSYMHTEDEITKVIRDLVARVADTAKEFGHEIKITDSYASEAVFTFSKTIYVGNITLPFSFRKIQKTYGVNNAFLPVLDDYIASSFSNAHSACAATVTTVPCYAVALLWVFYYLILHPIYQNLSRREMVALSLTPSVVGGLPIIYLHNMFVRAESDLLAAYLGLLLYLNEIDSPLIVYMSRFLHLATAKTSKVQLLQDPYSLPIWRPMTAGNFFKRVIRSILKGRIVNRDVKQLFTLYDHKARDRLVAALESNGEWPAKAFAALYANSPFQLLEELLTQFLTAKSIKDLLLTSRLSSKRTHNVLRGALRRDKAYHEWRVKVLKGGCEHTRRDWILGMACAGEAADRLRQEMWGTKITTITYPPIQHQIMIVSKTAGARDPYCRTHHFALTYAADDTAGVGFESDHYREGPYKPFMGQQTRTGNIAPQLRIIDTDPVASKLCTLLMLRDWTHTEMYTPDGMVVSNFPDLIDQVIQCYTATPVDQLAPITAVRKSGTMTHRMRAHGFRESIVPNTLQNVYTCMQGESNTHTHLRMDPKNITINFLHVFCYSIAMATYDLNYHPFTQCPPLSWIVTTPCPHCNQEILEPPIVLDPRLIRELSLFHLKLIKLSAPLETILGEALKDLTERTQHAVLPLLTEDDLPVASEAVIAEFLTQYWHSTRRWEQRYEMHHISPAHVETAAEVAGFHRAVRLSENDIRAVALDQLVHALAYAIRDFFEREMKAGDPSVITARLATMHDSDVPWFGVVAMIETCGFLYPFLLKVSEISGILPSGGAMNRIGAASRYTGLALYNYTTTLTSRSFILTSSNLENPERLHKRFQTLILPILSCHLGQLKKNGEISEDVVYGDPESVIIQYLSLVCPEIDANTLWATVQGNVRSEIEPLDIRRITAEDLLAITDDEHPRHRISQYWSYQFGTSRPEVLALTATLQIEDIKEAYGDVPFTIYPTLVIYQVNMSQCIDLCRRYPRYAEKKHVPEAVEYDLLRPRRIPRVNPTGGRGTAHRFNPVPGYDPYPPDEQDIDQAPGPALEQRAAAIQWTQAYRLLGSTTTSVSKFVDLLRIIQWPGPPYPDFGPILCCGEGEGGIASACLSLFPDSIVVYNSLITDLRLGQLPGIPLLEQGFTERLRYKMQEEGVSDLTEWNTCEALIESSPLPYSLIHCDADLPSDSRAITALQLWVNVAHMAQHYLEENGILIIKVFMDIPSVVAKISAKLIHAGMETWLLHTPVSHAGPEAYLVAINRRRPFLGERQAPTGRIRYHAEYMRTVRALLQTMNTTIRCHNERRPRRFGFQCDAIYAWQRRFLPWVFNQVEHVVHTSLALRHPGDVTQYSYNEYMAYVEKEAYTHLETLDKQIRSGGSEFRRNPTGRSRTLRHKVVLVERYLVVLTLVYCLEVRDHLHPHAWTDDVFHEDDIFTRACEPHLPFADVPIRINKELRTLTMGAYTIDYAAIIRRTFKPILRLVGFQYLDVFS
ncbi:polymerase [Tacheng Tick Virus 4]|uniref:Replicase n=1 Tax=Tacheng Tick Virus 4 TaxID=1608086 RepID=A0A0B5KT91_9VIRU|nr:polymerase [Tacheng Tick Virus 4]AJG39057.1 polymerase [Tacheng Tick Virus 4]